MSGIDRDWSKPAAMAIPKEGYFEVERAVRAGFSAHSGLLLVMKGSGEEPTPGSGAALEPGEFILGYPDEDGPVANLPEPEVLSRNGSYMAYRRLQEHVGAFRDYLRECRHPAGSGTAGRQVHGPLAQRRTTSARTGQRRSRIGRRPHA